MGKKNELFPKKYADKIRKLSTLEELDQLKDDENWKYFFGKKYDTEVLVKIFRNLAEEFFNALENNRVLKIQTIYSDKLRKDYYNNFTNLTWIVVYMKLITILLVGKKAEKQNRYQRIVDQNLAKQSKQQKKKTGKDQKNKEKILKRL